MPSTPLFSRLCCCDSQSTRLTPHVPPMPCTNTACYPLIGDRVSVWGDGREAVQNQTGHVAPYSERRSRSAVCSPGSSLWEQLSLAIMSFVLSHQGEDLALSPDGVLHRAGSCSGFKRRPSTVCVCVGGGGCKGTARKKWMHLPVGTEPRFIR